MCPLKFLGSTAVVVRENIKGSFLAFPVRAWAFCEKGRVIRAIVLLIYATKDLERKALLCKKWENIKM